MQWGGVDFAVSPHGDAMLLSARGDLFRVSLTADPVNLTHTPGADEDHPAWSPDGKMIAYETDTTGEQQIAIRPATGGPETILTHFETGYFYTPVWSPQGDSLLVADANHSLWWIHLDGRSAPERIAQDPHAEIRDAVFSPDGRWIGYSTQRPTQLRAIHLRELASGHDTVISSPMESDRSPVFTGDGSMLAFISQRNEQPFVSDRDDESLISSINSDGLYVATLRGTSPSPLLTASPGAAQGSVSPFHIDIAHLMERAVALPVTPSVITSLQARGSSLFYETVPVQLISGDLPGSTSALHAFHLPTLQDRILQRNIGAYSLSDDGDRVSFRRAGAWYLTATAASAPEEQRRIDTSKLALEVEPRRERAEMFENAWRLDRDVFFSPVMNGSDWQAVHDAYVRFLPSLGSPDDFIYLFGPDAG